MELPYAEPWDDEIDPNPSLIPNLLQPKSPLIIPEYSILRSPENIARICQLVVSELKPEQISSENLSQRINEFLQFAHAQSELSAIGFIDRKESFVAPILETFALWSHPILLSSDSQKMREFHRIHNQLLRVFHPDLTNYLHIVDPRRYPLESFPAELSKRSESLAFSRLIACGRFEK